MMIKLIYKTQFHAAHYLQDHPKCGKMHGHTYNVEVEYHGPIDSSSGMVRDFSVMKLEVHSIVEQYDHRTLNDIIQPPTAEMLAMAILTQLRARFQHDVPVKSGYKRVGVWETDSSGAEIEVS